MWILEGHIFLSVSFEVMLLALVLGKSRALVFGLALSPSWSLRYVLQACPGRLGVLINFSAAFLLLTRPWRRLRP